MMVKALGIDISKRKFDVALKRDGKYRDKEFTNNLEGFTKLVAWLKKQGAEKVHACMEATGTYGEELALFLCEQGHLVSIVNPACIKAYAQSLLTRNKTDKMDAHLIADYCEKQQPEVWRAPSPEERRLQALARHLEALEEIKQQEHNRLTSGVKQEQVIESLKSHIDYLEAEIKRIREQIDDHISSNPELKKKKELLLTIPGIGDTTSIKLLAEMGNLDNYSRARELAAYAGVSPQRHESGDSVKHSSRLSKIGKARLRKALYFPAIVAKQHNPIIREFCKKLKERGKAKMAIVGAAMRKLLHQVYGVLKSGKAFDPNYEPGGNNRARAIS